MKDISKQLARKVQDVQEKEEQLKAEIDAANSEIARLSNCINNGSEYRHMDCEVVKDFADKMKRYYRVDTGDLVHTEAMSSEDFQLDAFESHQPDGATA